MRREDYRYLTGRLKLFVITATMVVLFLLLGFTAHCIREKQFSFILLAGYVLVALLAAVYYRWLYVPWREARKVLQAFADGYMVQGIFEHAMDISPDLEQTFQKFEEILRTSDLVNASKEQAQYLALQNQINPHFLYNTLEGIRGETLSAGLENVTRMTEALATFFRYTISNLDHLVTLEDELGNVENYYIIQQYRFGERLALETDFEEGMEREIMSCKIPKLTLQPIVENAIYHGIERKIGKGTVRIKIEMTAKRLIITVSDDGMGMDGRQLQMLNEKLHGINPGAAQNKSRGGIAIANVNTRIKLLFGEEYGICIYSVESAGTDVEITLPAVSGNAGGGAWQRKS